MGQLIESNSVLAVGLTLNIASTLNSLENNTTSNDSSSMDTSKQVSMPFTKFFKTVKRSVLLVHAH